MPQDVLFSSFKLGSTELGSRIVMAPMTRSRSPGSVPDDLVATYYGQRAGAGLIITEGTSPSPNGLGYARIPGLYSDAQVEGWKKTTRAVHEKGGRIFVQLMHSGRVGVTQNLPPGARSRSGAASRRADRLLLIVRVVIVIDIVIVVCCRAAPTHADAQARRSELRSPRVRPRFRSRPGRRLPWGPARRGTPGHPSSVRPRYPDSTGSRERTADLASEEAASGEAASGQSVHGNHPSAANGS